jgi:hypothetical protein
LFKLEVMLEKTLTATAPAGTVAPL